LAVPLRLLAVGLPLTIVAGTVLALGVIPELSVIEALILAIILAPTDAALGKPVVTDERLPSRIRQGLNIESGLNDGICVPLLLIAVAFAEADEGLRSFSSAIRVVVEEIGYGALAGVVAGALAAAALRFGKQYRLIESSWVQILPAAAAALAYGLAVPLDGSGFIAAFVGGLAFGALTKSDEGETTYLVEETGEILSAVTFLVFGAVILGPALTDLTWEAVVYAILSLTVIRMVPVALALLGSGARAPTVAFLAWFGPRGLASIVFAVIVLDTSLLHIDPIVLAVVATIALSVYAHGLSARPMVSRYAKWYQAHPDDNLPRMESVPAAEQPWRGPTAIPSAIRKTDAL
jgi:NhaP-type Na+/H+ or K+/H+ antiporter